MLMVLSESVGMSVNEMLEQAVFDGVSPAICMNCHATTNMEPDQDRGYCEECGENKVVSAPVLAGIM
jgi:hypothetical protein